MTHFFNDRSTPIPNTVISVIVAFFGLSSGYDLVKWLTGPGWTASREIDKVLNLFHIVICIAAIIAFINIKNIKFKYAYNALFSIYFGKFMVEHIYRHEYLMVTVFSLALITVAVFSWSEDFKGKRFPH